MGDVANRNRGEQIYMRAILQRVSEASVTVGGDVTGKIDKGLLVLVGMGKEDTDEDIKKLVDKIVKLMLF